MSLIDNSNTLLREQLGKGTCDVIATTAMTGKDYYAVHFVTTSVITSIAIAGATTATGSAIANLNTTIPAGTCIYGRVTAINLASGVAICYYETDGKTSE
tara:strand:+ start:408 stop:707 length:300 start_codon:yes stop_codon:yes gene_type:complete